MLKVSDRFHFYLVKFDRMRWDFSLSFFFGLFFVFVLGFGVWEGWRLGPMRAKEKEHLLCSQVYLWSVLLIRRIMGREMKTERLIIGVTEVVPFVK